MTTYHKGSTSQLDSLAHDQLARVHGGRKEPAERTAARRVRADNARALKQYNRPPETPAGRAVVDALSLVPGVKDAAAAHRLMRGVTEGTAFRGAGRPAY